MITDTRVKTYGQFCPVAKAAELFCERWTMRALGVLTLASVLWALR